MNERRRGRPCPLDASHLIDKGQFQNGVKGFREHKQSFNAIGEAKVSALRSLLDAGLDVLLSDVDVVWMGNPMEYLDSGHVAMADIAGREMGSGGNWGQGGRG